VLHSLHLAATNRETVLRNYWRKASNSLNRGRTEAPHAYVVPADQPRRADVAHLLNLLQRHGVELHRARGSATFGDVGVRAGDFVIRMDQPYRDFIKNLMEVQDFPENAPRPYDDVAWTLPMLYNVTAHEVADRSVLDATFEPVSGAVVLPGSVRVAGRGAPEWWLVRYEASSHALPARHELRDVAFYAAREAFDAGGATWQPGTWLIPATGIERGRLDGWAAKYGLEVVGVNDARVRAVPRHRRTSRASRCCTRGATRRTTAPSATTSTCTASRIRTCRRTGCGRAGCASATT
jgi:hypothetical protein